MSNFKGKRMVSEDLIKKLETLTPGGGGEYTAGVGIDIDSNNEITADIKAGSGIVIDTDLTDDSIVVMVDQEDIPYKSDLATVATTGDYDDLTNKPTLEDMYNTYTLTSSFKSLTNEEAEELYSKIESTRILYDGKYYYLSFKNSPTFFFVCDYQSVVPSRNLLQYEFMIFNYNNNNNYIGLSNTGQQLANYDNTTITYDNVEEKVQTIVGGGYDGNAIAFSLSDFASSGSEYLCSNTVFVKALLQTIAWVTIYNGWSGFQLYFLDSNNNPVDTIVEVSWSESGNTVTVTFNNSNICTSQSTYTYNKETGELITDPTTITFTSTFYNMVSSYSLVALRNDYPQGARVIKTIDSKFIPIDGTSITVDGNGKLTVPAPTLTKTTETLTFTYSDNTTGTLTVVTDVTLS